MTTQLDCSIGLKEETVYGTGVTVDQWLEHTEESLDANLTFAQGEGMRVGSRVARADRRVLTKKEFGGGVGLALACDQRLPGGRHGRLSVQAVYGRPAARHGRPLAGASGGDTLAARAGAQYNTSPAKNHFIRYNQLYSL